MGDDKEKGQKIPLLNSIFGENSDGENGLKVFADTWKDNEKWGKGDYITITSVATILGGGLYMVGNALVVGAVTNSNPIDKTLSQENISIIQDGANGYAVIKAEDGSQLYNLSNDMSQITLIKDPKQAQETAQKVINYFEDMQNTSFGPRYPKPVQAKHITIALNGGDETVIRNLSEVETLSVYNPVTYSQDQIAFWGDVLSDIESDRYNVPSVETLPLSKGENVIKAINSPSSFLAGAFVLNAFIYGIGGVLPNARKTIPKLSRPGFGKRKDAPESGNDEPSL